MPRYGPQWPIILFGNAIQGRVIRMIPGMIEEDGVEVTEIHMMPTPEMMDYYNLQNEDLNDESAIVRRYPTIMIVPLNLDPIINTIMVLCDFNWGDTVLTRKYPDLQTIEDYQKERRMLLNENARLHEDMALKTSRLKEYFKKEVEMIQTVRKTGGEINPEGQPTAGEEESE